MKRTQFALIFVSLAGLTFAQERTTLPPEVTTPTQATTLTPAQKRKLDIFTELGAGLDRAGTRDPAAYVRAQSFTKAKDSLKRNDLAAAESFLTALNPFEPNTGDWHFDAAQQWLALAGDLSRQSDRTHVPVVVTQTLQNLGRAEMIAREKGDTRLEASAKRTAGFLHDRYRGNPEAAIAAYRAALKLAPNDQPTQEALTRLERSLAVVQARTRNRK